MVNCNLFRFTRRLAIAYTQRDDVLAHIIHEFSFLNKPTELVISAPAPIDILADGARKLPANVLVKVREDYVSTHGSYNLQEMDEMRSFLHFIEPREMKNYFPCLIGGLRVIWPSNNDRLQEHILPQRLSELKHLSAELIVAASRVFR